MSMNPKRPVSAILSAAMLLGISSPPVQALDTSTPTDSRLCSEHTAHTPECGGMDGECKFVCPEHTPQILPELHEDMVDGEPTKQPESLESTEQTDLIPLIPAAPIVPTDEIIPGLPLNPAQKTEQAETIPLIPLEEETPPIMPFARARDVVYTSATGSNHSNHGNGTQANPYNLFTDAVENVMPGGTIIIQNKAFLNTLDERGNQPYIIDKDVIIKSEDSSRPASLQVRSGGIILGGNVTFQDVALSFENRVHDAIFANGHTLTLKNVLRANGSREVDLFGGQLYDLNTHKAHADSQKGSNSEIIIEMDQPHLPPLSSMHLGNIYAGSMNGKFDGNVTIRVSDTNQGKTKFIGQVYASGAKEADPGNMLDIREPAPPVANADTYPVSGTVTMDFDSLPLRGSVASPMLIDGKTGTASGKTKLSVSVDSPTGNVKLKDIFALTVEQGTIQPSDLIGTPDSIKIAKSAGLDLTQTALKDFITGTLSGEGTLTLKKDGLLTVTNSFNNSTLTFQTEGAWNGKSGIVIADHTYVIAPTTSTGTFNFKPHSGQSSWKLESQEDTTTPKMKKWIAKGSGDSGAPTIEPLVKFEIQPDKAHITVNQSCRIDTHHTYDPANTINFPLTIQDKDGHVVDSLDPYDFTCKINNTTISRTIHTEDDGSFYVTYDDPDSRITLTFTLDDIGNPAIDISPMLDTDSSADIKPFKIGEHKIVLSIPSASGEILQAIAYLTVTEDPPAPSTNPGASNSAVIVKPSESSTTFGKKITVSAEIAKATMFSARTIEKDKAYLYINGKLIKQADVTNPTDVNNQSVQFNDIAVTPENGFHAGESQISVVYSGGNKITSLGNINGSTGTTNITIKKATPQVEMKDSNITEIYNGAGITYIPQNIIVTSSGLTISNPEFSVIYKTESGTRLEHPPVLPGKYKTEIQVSEGTTYQTALADGPTITIAPATPTVTVSGSVAEKNLVLTANVEGVESGALPTGTVTFSIAKKDGSSSRQTSTANLLYNTATSTIPKPEAGEYIIQATYNKAKENTVYTDSASSAQIPLKIATNHKSVESIALDYKSLSLVRDDTSKQLKVTYAPAEPTNKGIVWTSSNNDVATVSTNGTVQPKNVGTTTIQARSTDGDHVASCVVTVTDKEIDVTAVKLDRTKIEMAVKETDQLSASIEPYNATNQGVTWSITSSNPADTSNPVVEIKQDGTIKALRAGTATIQVQSKAKPSVTTTCQVTVKDTIAVDKVQLNTKNMTLTEGDTAKLTAGITPYNATNQKVNWSVKSSTSRASSNNSVVTVDTDGNIRAMHEGTATIVAEIDGKSSECAIIVKSGSTPHLPTPSEPKIEISPDHLDLKVGGGAGQLTATVTNDSAASKTIKWTVEGDDPSVITLSQPNALTTDVLPQKAGTVTVKATYTESNGKTATATATVEVKNSTVPDKPAVTGVQIDGGDTSLKTGTAHTFTAKVLPATAPQTVTWSASPSGILSVDASTGRVTALKAGKATLTATSTVASDKSGSITVTVADVPVTEVKITEAPLSLREGRGAQLVVRVSPSDATNREVKWESDDTRILTVDRDGYVTAHRKGSATITVTSVAHPELKDSRTISVTASSSGGGGSSGGGSSKPSKPDKKPETKPETPKPETQPAIPPTVNPELPKPGVPVINTAPPVNPTLNTTFNDLPQTHWAAEPVKDVVSRGLFVGTEKGNFSPDESMTRGMLVTVLHRLAGEPIVQSSNQFTDVGRTYYTDAVTWANQNKIVSGTSANTFGPNRMVTREELVVMLYRMANPVPGISTNLNSFTDAGKISGWASAPMQWAVKTGILKGSDGALLPQKELSRAEAASLISRFTDKILTH